MANVQEESKMKKKKGVMSGSNWESNDAYFKMVQSKKKLPHSLQQSLTESFARIPVSSFPSVPGGKVIEITADTSILDAVGTLSDSGIMSAPVVNPAFADSPDWKKRYLGILDYAAVVLWVLENADNSSASTGVGVPSTVQEGESIFLPQEPFKSTTVMSILETYRWAPFVPVAPDSSMLSVLLLLSKYRLRNVPLIESGSASIKNYVTQSAVVQGLHRCKGRDWFDYISACPLADLGLPFVSSDQLITAGENDLILQVFQKMKDKHIGGVPITTDGGGSSGKILSSISVRDIRFLLHKPKLFSNLRAVSVKEFVGRVGSEYGNDALKPVTCRPESSVGDVIEKLASRAVHRVYVVGGDEEQEEVVMGVITLRDVISCFIYEPPNYSDTFLGFPAQEMLNH